MRLILAGLLFLIFQSWSLAQDLRTGNWKGIIIYEQAEVPFQFNISSNDSGEYTVTLKNGSESIPINNVRWQDDSLVIPMHAFDAEIIAKVSKNQMSGRWVKYYKNNPGIPFRAEFNESRFTSSSKSRLIVPEELKMTMTPVHGMPYETIGLFEQTGSKITGTILAEVGDFRYFEGVVSGDSIKASSFDGVHAFLLLGRFDNGQWTGELIMDSNYAEPWSGKEDTNFELADPFIELDPSDPEKQEPYFDILTAGSGFNSLEKDEFYGRVTIIQLLGSWCPNSLDETQYLTRWYDANKQRDIEVLAVFYEMNYSKAYGTQRMNDYVTYNEIPYPTALGGPANKGQAALAFPFVDKLQAFPTLMILDKTGKVRYMHTYFQGPATGSYFKDFDKKFNSIVDLLLKE